MSNPSTNPAPRSILTRLAPLARSRFEVDTSALNLLSRLWLTDTYEAVKQQELSKFRTFRLRHLEINEENLHTSHSICTIQMNKPLVTRYSVMRRAWTWEPAEKAIYLVVNDIQLTVDELGEVRSCEDKAHICTALAPLCVALAPRTEENYSILTPPPPSALPSPRRRFLAHPSFPTS